MPALGGGRYRPVHCHLRAVMAALDADVLRCARVRSVQGDEGRQCTRHGWVASSSGRGHSSGYRRLRDARAGMDLNWLDTRPIGLQYMHAPLMLPAPAMQYVGIDPLFTRQRRNGCSGLQACCHQLRLELRTVAAPCATPWGVGNWCLFRHGVHDDLSGHDLALGLLYLPDGIAGRLPF